MTANDVITTLTTSPNGSAPAWIQQAALVVQPRKAEKLLTPYETTAARFFTEVTVRIPTTRIAKRTGKKYLGLQRRRIDLVAVIQANKFSYHPIIAGIEVKISEHDLMGDDKMQAYLPFCDLFLIAVPSELATQAKIKASQVEADNEYPAGTPMAPNTIGVITISELDALITHPPRPLKPHPLHLKEIYAELLIKPFKN